MTARKERINFMVGKSCIIRIKMRNLHKIARKSVLLIHKIKEFYEQ